MEFANAVIIGGGVVGCAVARVLSKRWDNVFLLEQMPKVGMAASSRNSGVIHSGLYYTPGSLKARHCLEGNRLTYEFCAEHNVPHRRTGKLVVACTPDEEAELGKLLESGRANGLEGLRIIDRAEICRREPHIQGRAALAVPSTGIVASEELVKAYARLAAEQGANILTHARVVRLEPRKDFIRVEIRIGEAEKASTETAEARCVVNAAGLYADEVAAMLGNTRYRIYPVRGEYCELVRAKSYLINALVYPMPHPEGLSLGVHFTRTLWGTVLVGPTARYVAHKNDYERDRLPVEEFARLGKRLLPELEAADLVLAYSGLRAKLVPPGGKGPADFVIARDPDVPRAIQLLGIESPGLTAAPSIANQVFELVREILD
ncbi:MAG: NAD(P)/FAD-dependent oxidoreductase [Acidobacteria bacterium]|nr:NAD(P)/FAD-dependent oxidoreductase [Acidobacteriota bacterium]